MIQNLAICMASISAHSKSDTERNAFIQQLVGNMRSGHDLTRYRVTDWKPDTTYLL